MQIFTRICARIVKKYNPFLKNVPFCVVQHVLRTKTLKNIIYLTKSNKKYIYTMYIYSKRHENDKKSCLSYGYPMGMVWVSYGAGSRRIGN